MAAHPAAATTRPPDDDPLSRTIDALAEILPAQGPISIFIHHNTLHAFEHQPFEDAVERAAVELGREPYLAEARYREKLATGRILPKDVDHSVAGHLGTRAHDDVAGIGSRQDLWCAVILHGFPTAHGHELTWMLEETGALSRFRRDVPAAARAAIATLLDQNGRSGEERRAVRRLWSACLAAAGRADAAPVPTAAPPVRHRDWLVAASGLDSDAWMHPPLIRFLAGYLDQGLAHWAMPERTHGIHGCFLEMYGTTLARHCGPWARTLPAIVVDDQAAERDALDSIAHSLAELGVAEPEWSGIPPRRITGAARLGGHHSTD